MSTEEERLALQTLRERCWGLQQRLESVERDNAALAAGAPTAVPEPARHAARLVREKAQLAHHVLAVARENRKLWARLAALSKTQAIPDKAEYHVPMLARSQTFTHSSPNFKHPTKIEKDNKDYQNSLEEISLKLINSFMLEKNELISQYEHMIELQMSNEKVVGTGSTGTNCLDNYGNNTLTEIRKCVDKMAEMKNTIQQQQLDLKKIVNNIKTKEPLKSKCHECSNITKKISDITISNETVLDNSDIEISDSLRKWKPTNSLRDRDNYNADRDGISEGHLGPNRSGDSVWQNSNIKIPKSGNKKKDNICPLCGVNFLNLNFDKFELHVESHFLASEDSDSICDNYEIVYKK